MAAIYRTEDDLPRIDTGLPGLGPATGRLQKPRAERTVHPYLRRWTPRSAAAFLNNFEIPWRHVASLLGSLFACRLFFGLLLEVRSVPWRGSVFVLQPVIFPLLSFGSLPLSEKQVASEASWSFLEDGAAVLPDFLIRAM